MATTSRPYQPDQLLLLSPDLREWLPPGHLAQGEARARAYRAPPRRPNAPAQQRGLSTHGKDPDLVRLEQEVSDLTVFAIL